MMAIRLALMMSEIGSSRAAVLFTEQSTSIFFSPKCICLIDAFL